MTIKIRLDHVLRVYISIFQKVSILFPDPVIAYLGLLCYQELIMSIKIGVQQVFSPNEGQYALIQEVCFRIQLERCTS